MRTRTDRPALERRDGQRVPFTAVVERFGTKSNWHGFPEPTILLRDVRFTDNDSQAADHIWFTVGKTIARLGLQPGNSVSFTARIEPYLKGLYPDLVESYKLTRPTRWSR